MISPLSRQFDAGQPVNWAHSLNRGRVAWHLVSPAGHPSYRGGSRLLDLCRKYHGTLVGAPTWRGPNRPGGWGHLAFDGAGGHVAIPLSAAGLTSLTVGVWFRMNENGNTRGILSWAAAPLSGSPFLIIQSHVATLQVYVNGNYNILTARTQGIWYRALVTWTGAVWTLYLNGAVAGTYSGGATNQAGASTLYLGAGFSSYPIMDGDEPTVWTRALSTTEIRADYILSRQEYPGVLNWAARRFVAGEASLALPRCVGDDGPDLGWLAA